MRDFLSRVFFASIGPFLTLGALGVLFDLGPYSYMHPEEHPVVLGALIPVALVLVPTGWVMTYFSLFAWERV